MRASHESSSTVLGARPSAPPQARPSGSAIPIDVQASLPAGISSATADEITRVRPPPPVDAWDAAAIAPDGPAASPPPLDEWHIGLRDVAVGPLRGGEIGRMLGAGTLTLDSLVWRRGFGSWLPIRQIPELAPAKPAPLFASGVPGAASDLMSSPMPAIPPAAPGAPAMRATRGERSSRSPAATVSSRAPQSHSIGPASGRASPAAWRAPPHPGSWTGTLMTAFGLALLMTGTAITGARVWDARNQSIVRPLSPATTQRLVAIGSEARRDSGPDALPVAVRPRPEASILELPLGRAAESVELSAERQDADPGSHPRGQGRQRRAPGRGLHGVRERLAAVQPADSAAATPELSSAGLTAEQLSRVVLRGRVKLQRCYEIALRGSRSEDAVRIQLGITIAAAGTVVNVETRGQTPPGMGRCLEHAVRTWRFPAAAESTHTEFPVVFQPGR